jgi:isopentenyl-diphosphate delta-isomerase
MTEQHRPAGSNGSAGQATAAKSTSQRKGEHIRICLEEEVNGEGITSGFERYRFRHNALPELAFRDIDTTSSFLGKPLRAPLIVSSMTGGTGEAGSVNLRLAEAAQAKGWAMGLGSMRAAIESSELAATFRVRSVAPTIPLLANLGAVQLNYGFGVDQCRRAVDLAEADGLVLHLNSLQEVFQPEGNSDFRGLLERIAEVCRSIGVPVGVKEVGWGIDGDTAARLAEAGVSFIDAAGAGGTSWSQVEKYRLKNTVQAQAAEAFAGWGTPTAECVKEIRGCLPGMTVIASGGLGSGVDAAKAIALGADLAGFGRVLLPRAASGEPELRAGALQEQFERIEFELRTAMFGIGTGSLQALRATDRLIPTGR